MLRVRAGKEYKGVEAEPIYCAYFGAAHFMSRKST
jgi:hypothetical protein